VATFLGTPAGNLIPVVRDGAILRFGFIEMAPAGIAPGQEEAQLLYRSQDITVGRREGCPTLQAIYAESSPIAGQSMVTCLVGEMRITAMVDGFYRAVPGEPIEISFLKGPDAVFDSTGKRISE